MYVASGLVVVNQESIKQLLTKAKLSRAELAKMCGCHVKTTYWLAPPAYALTILTLYIANIKANQYFKLQRELVLTNKGE